VVCRILCVTNVAQFSREKAVKKSKHHFAGYLKRMRDLQAAARLNVVACLSLAERKNTNISQLCGRVVEMSGLTFRWRGVLECNVMVVLRWSCRRVDVYVYECVEEG